VSLVDILPTLIELSTGKLLQGVEGVSLVPLLKKGGQEKVLTEKLKNRILFAHRIVDVHTSEKDFWSENNSENQHWAAIFRNWNLIEWWEGKKKELFNHSLDMQEKHDVFVDHPEITSYLLGELKKFKTHGKSQITEKVSVNLDEELLNNLKVLGYVE
jgi:hypothetical protein